MIEEIKINGVLYKLVETVIENTNSCNLCALDSICDKHLGLVAGGSYTLDLQKKEINLATIQAGPLIEFKRSVLYANLGLECKIF